MESKVMTIEEQIKEMIVCTIGKGMCKDVFEPIEPRKEFGCCNCKVARKFCKEIFGFR